MGWFKDRLATAGWVLVSGVAGLLAAGAVQAAVPAERQAAPLPAKPASASGFGVQAASADARYALQWVMANADNQGLPFAVVDKKAARLFVFSASGQLVGTTAALLGLTPGDRTVPGVGQRVQNGTIGRDERTTPAGRFIAEPGHNLKGEPIVWVDYEAAFAIHRLRPSPAAERRPQRLASATVDDNRISLGCVVVPAGFYDGVVAPTLGQSRSVVYVLPETRPVESMFNDAALGLAQSQPQSAH